MSDDRATLRTRFGENGRFRPTKRKEEFVREAHIILVKERPLVRT